MNVNVDVLSHQCPLTHRDITIDIGPSWFSPTANMAKAVIVPNGNVVVPIFNNNRPFAFLEKLYTLTKGARSSCIAGSFWRFIAKNVVANFIAGRTIMCG